MRKTWDRIRHTILFEIIGLIIIVPLSSHVFNLHSGQMGILAIGFALFAPFWNFCYNLWFDRAMLKYQGSVHKTPLIRVYHAIGFEATLLSVALPVTAWWLDVTLWFALTMDIALALFYVVYAYIYNWCYDFIFPIPAQEPN